MIAGTGWQALYALPTEWHDDAEWQAWDLSAHVRLDVVAWEEVVPSSSTPVISGWVVSPHVLGQLGGYLVSAPAVVCLSEDGRSELDFMRYIRVTDEVTYRYVESAP